MLGLDFEFGDEAMFQFRHLGRAGQRDFVESVVAMNNHHVFRPQFLQHARLDTDQIAVEYTHDLVRRTGWIGQRPQNIQDRAHAQFFSHRRRVLHGRVMIRRKHETDTDLTNAIGDLHRREIEIDAK